MQIQKPVQIYSKKRARFFIVLGTIYLTIHFSINVYQIIFEDNTISLSDTLSILFNIAAAVICDSVIRILPGAISDETSALTDSFQSNRRRVVLVRRQGDRSDAGRRVSFEPPAPDLLPGRPGLAKPPPPLELSPPPRKSARLVAG